MRFSNVPLAARTFAARYQQSSMPSQPIQERIERIREGQEIDDDGQRDQDEKSLGAVSGDFPRFRHSATVDLR
jgi:hypothetical protein